MIMAAAAGTADAASLPGTQLPAAPWQRRLAPRTDPHPDAARPTRPHPGHQWRHHRRATTAQPHPWHQPHPITSADNPPAPPFPVFSRSSSLCGGTTPVAAAVNTATRG